MIDRCNQSGWLVESPGQPHGDFEIVAACPRPYRGVAHLRHDQALPFTSLETWSEVDRIRSSQLLGPLLGTACILSKYGNLEAIVAHADGSLAHFWRQDIFGWHGPIFLPGQAAGPPAFIQSRYGAFGNFEVIVPRPGGGLSHFWRDNDQNADWRQAPHLPCDAGQWSGVGLIHSSDGLLEIIGVADGQLKYLFQQGVGRDWEPPQVLAAGFQGRPCLIQNSVFPESNFLSVAALTQGGLACFVRNHNTQFAWRERDRFGKGRGGESFQFNDVTMIESSFGRTEIVASMSQPGLPFKHYRQGEPWEGPNDVPGVVPDP
jgi:hypothetical protein